MCVRSYGKLKEVIAPSSLRKLKDITFVAIVFSLLMSFNSL